VGRFSQLAPVGVSAFCLFDQTCKLFLENGAFNLEGCVSFMAKALIDFRQACAVARAG
jgi:hypothetical protein